MRFPVRLIMLALLGSALAHADDAPMSRYMACARALGVTISEQFAVIPGDKGLFVYTDAKAFFLPLGAPRVEDSQAREFFLKTHISSIGEIFLIFRENKGAGSARVQSSIGYVKTPPQSRERDAYFPTQAHDSPGDQARLALSKRLREKIVTVKDFIDYKNSYSTPAEAKLAFEKDRSIYLAKLESCRFDEDRGLKLVAAEEMQKLETGFPGPTIWEKQIGGRAPSGHAAR